MAVGTVEAIVDALDARLDARISWRGPELDRLADAGHAALQAATVRRLEAWGWHVRVEVSFNHFGERGRIDILARHPANGTLLVLEIKTELADAQALLGTMDVRVRLAPAIVRALGWPRPVHIVPALVFMERRVTRRRLAGIDALLGRYALRGRAAISWVRRPGAPAPSGLLWFTEVSDVAVVRISGQRVRLRGSERRARACVRRIRQADPG